MLPFGLEITHIITGLVAVSAFLAVIAVWFTAVERDPLRARVKSLREREESLKAEISGSRRRGGPMKRENAVNQMRRIVKKLKLLGSKHQEKVTLRLAQAGYRSKDAVIVFLFAKLIAPAVGAGLGGLLAFPGNLGDSAGMRLLVMVIAVLAGFFAPDIMVYNARSKRVSAIRKALPDALDLLVICAEAGLTLDAALKRVAREMAHSSRELADEFALTAIELGFLSDRREALDNLARRVPLPAMRSVVATLIQTERYGTPLARSLRVLSSEFRNERLMKAEEKAARLPAIMTVPLIGFIFPMIFIVLLGPAACNVADNIIGRF